MAGNKDTLTPSPWRRGGLSRSRWGRSECEGKLSSGWGSRKGRHLDRGHGEGIGLRTVRVNIAGRKQSMSVIVT